uniref:SLC26A/SulP transporter domain-containing protein n=1 Tax=Astatotilapia calliptera TaxID=8154 RepID=A0AAX7UA56_ASTCA
MQLLLPQHFSGLCFWLHACSQKESLYLDRVRQMESARRSERFRVERDVLDELKLEEVTQRKSYADIHSSLSEQLKNALRCNIHYLKQSIVRRLPVLYWLPKYSVWDYGMPDLISGISVGIMHLPQGMAYALLASLPPVFGLYSSLYPALVYFFFGTSRHVSIGTFTVLSIMVGSVTERLAPDVDFQKANGTNITAEVDVTARDSYRVQVAAATTVLGGLIQVLLGVVKFGFVGTYLSEPLVRAYTTAAAAHAVVAQLKYIFGVSPTRFSGPLSLVYTLKDVCSSLPNTHLPTLLVSVVTIVLLIAAKELNSFLSSKLPVPIPVELITIVAGTLISSYAHLNTNYTISVVGEIPSGLSSPSVPDVNLFGEVIGDAFALAIVGYAITISLGKTFALKHGYKVDSNQELVALGLSNTVGGFFQCFSVCSSMSRSLIQDTTGVKTQMAGVASSLIVLVIILKLGTLFQELPKAVLSAVVFVNLKGMFKQYYDIITLWRSSKIDLVVWLVTWVSTLLLNLDLGLAASVTFAVFTVIFRTQLPTYSVLGNIPGTELYVDIEMHREARGIPGVTIFRSSATVYFANADLYLEALKEKSGLNISKMIIYKRRQEAKQKRRERRAERRAKRQAKREVMFSILFSFQLLSFGVTAASLLAHCIFLSCANHIYVISHHIQKPPFWAFFLFLLPGSSTSTTFSQFTQGLLYRQIFQDFSEIDVDVYMAGCQASVVEQLEHGDFFSEKITKRRLFASVHDAVLHCLNHRRKTKATCITLTVCEPIFW